MALRPAFDGIRVVEFASGKAGPMASMIMADNGAEVIKVEPPDGDWARNEPGFLMWNRGKLSVVLDLTKSQGFRRARSLIATADVVLESYRPGVADRLGIGFAAASRVNPGIVYCSVSGFGDAERLAGIKGYEPIVAAKSGSLCGLDELQGAAAAPRRSGPVFKVVRAGAFAASQFALQGVASALFEKARTGRGAFLSTSILQGVASLVMRRDFAKSPLSQVDRSEDTLYRGIKLTFLTAECRDGKWIQMCARQDAHFENWLRALGLDDLLTDPRYSGGPLRIPSVDAIEELELVLRSRMKERDQSEWMRIFVDEYDVGADPFLTPDEFINHPQMVANRRIARVDSGSLGPSTQVGRLVLSPDTESRPLRGAPTLGEHQGQLRSLLDADRGRGRGSNGVSPGPTAQDSGPLSGVTVLELAYYLAGPLGGTLLAELGARVIKVEPADGDPWRRIGLESVHLLHGKQSIAIDLKSPRGKAILHELIGLSDALLTSFRPQVHAKLGFDYKTASDINPRLVFLYAGSYGSEGPWSHRAAFHSTPNALSGSGILQAGAGNPPVDDSYPDPVAGMANASAIVLGLLARERNGVGQYLETTMLCSTAYALSEHLVFNGEGTKALPQDERQQGLSALRRLYPCAQGWLMLYVVQEDEWRHLAMAMGLNELITDERFATPDGRRENDAVLTQLISSVLIGKTAEDWEQHLGGSDVPAVRADGPALEDFLVAHFPMVPRSHPSFGEYWQLPSRVRFGGRPSNPEPACAVGEHTLLVLRELGYSDASIDALLADRVVWSAAGPYKKS